MPALRAQLGLQGVDWRSWSAADVCAVSYLLLVRELGDDTTKLRALFELADDRYALAQLDRTIMGQSPQIETTF